LRVDFHRTNYGVHEPLNGAVRSINEFTGLFDRHLSRNQIFYRLKVCVVVYLVDLSFVPRVHIGVQMGLRGVDDSLFPIIAPSFLCEVLRELQGPTAIYTDGSKTEGLVEIGMFLDDKDSYRFRLPGHFSTLKCAPFILPAI
jgi:hypothetical protein